MLDLSEQLWVLDIIADSKHQGTLHALHLSSQGSIIIASCCDCCIYHHPYSCQRVTESTNCLQATDIAQLALLPFKVSRWCGIKELTTTNMVQISK